MAADDALCLRPLLSKRHVDAFEKEGLAWILDMQVPDPLYAERTQRIVTQLRAAAVLRAFLEQVGWSQRDVHRGDYAELSAIIPLLSVPEKIKRILWFLNREANEAKHQRIFASRL